MDSFINVGLNAPYRTGEYENANAPPIHTRRQSSEKGEDGTILAPSPTYPAARTNATVDRLAAHSNGLNKLREDPYSMTARSASQSLEHAMLNTTSSSPPSTCGLQMGKVISPPIIPSLDLLAHVTPNITHDQPSSGMLQSTTSALLGKSLTRRSYECPLCHAGEQDASGQDIHRSAKLKNIWTSPTRFQAHIRASHINLFQINSPEGFVCWLCPCTGRISCPAKIAKESELINHLAVRHSDPSGRHCYNCHLCYSFLPIPDARETRATHNRMMR